MPPPVSPLPPVEPLPLLELPLLELVPPVDLLVLFFVGVLPVGVLELSVTEVSGEGVGVVVPVLPELLLPLLLLVCSEEPGLVVGAGGWRALKVNIAPPIIASKPSDTPPSKNTL